MSRPDAPQVVVAVLTFHREEQIGALVPLLLDQIEAAKVRCRGRLVVIDNAPDGGAAEIVEEAFGSAPHIPTRYVNERRPGLVAARNRALDEAAGADALVFIDDDERPTEGWLRLLVETWLTSEAWAVTGPVRSEFETEPDPWVLGSTLFDRVRAETGSVRVSAATNNLLVDMRRVRDVGLRFDERFSATGGEDSRFSQELLGLGGSIVWCDEAEVSETVPAARLERGWVRKRSMRFGESWAFARLSLRPPGWRRVLGRAEFLARGLLMIGTHLVPAWWARIRDDARRQGWHDSRVIGGWGICRGALGRRYQEYKR